MPHTVRYLVPDDETVAELNMLVGFDDDLVCEVTRTKNRLRGLLGRPADLFHTEGRQVRLVTLLRPQVPRMAERFLKDIFDALDQQTVVVPGTYAATLIVSSIAVSLTAVLDQRKVLAARLSRSCWRPTLFPGA